LSKLHLDDEKLIRKLEKVVKWVDKVNDNVNWASSYVKKGGELFDKAVDKLERKAEYVELNNNPYAYRNKEEVLVFEKEIVKEQKVQVQEQNKSWFGKFWSK
jgi:hypothetical protein